VVERDLTDVGAGEATAVRLTIAGMVSSEIGPEARTDRQLPPGLGIVGGVLIAHRR
jgi:hypothetical protein